jgi:K+-sensing histidine kinase KdpD
MLDFKTHIPSVFGSGLWLITTAAVPFLPAFLPQLSNSCNQLSIFPTATLPFVILSLEKKSMQLAHRMSKSSMKTAAGRVWTLPLMDAAIGGLVCALAALALTAAANGHTWKNMAPLIFTVVLLIIAGLFGSRAGIIGTVVAAMIFASFLFNPMGNVQVADETARGNLGWMMLIGIGFSFLFAPPSSGFRRH